MLIKKALDFLKQPCFLDLSKNREGIKTSNWCETVVQIYYNMVKFYKCMAARKCMYGLIF